MGAALLQRMPGDRSFHPVAFFSRKLNQAQQNYSATGREMLAIVEALRFWQHLLHGLEFKVRTDHKPLSSFFTQPNLSGRQLRWAERLSEFPTGCQPALQDRQTESGTWCTVSKTWLPNCSQTCHRGWISTCFLQKCCQCGIQLALESCSHSGAWLSMGGVCPFGWF